jgi:hypothetical protein
MDREEKTTTGERREYVRYACRTELKTIIDFNPHVARRASNKLPPMTFHRGEIVTVRNISQKGISIELEHFLPEGMTIKMSIDNPVTPPIETRGRVIWTKESPGEKEGYIVGMAFRYMRDKHRRNLDKLIEFLQTIPE